MNTLTKAKAALILDQPFFASLLLGMSITEDKNAKTLETDGESIRYNPEFMAGLSLPETVFVLAHETMHAVFQHMHRRGGKNANRWNIAADYVINDILTREKIGIMPAGGLLDSALVAEGKGTAEGVYNLLPESTEDKNTGDTGGALDQVNDASTDPAENSAKQAEMQVKIIQAGNAAKAAGKLSAGLDRLVKGLTATKTDWKSVLRRFLSERAKVDYSFAKPKRRFLADDIYLPSLTGDKMGEIVVAIDCSGSIGDKTIADFSAEIKAIFEDTKPSALRVLYFDTEILRADTFGPDDTVTITPIGGGGTSFAPIFEYIRANDLIPAACVVLTDLESSHFGEMPECPVLWATIAPGPAPFGETVLIQA